MTNIEGWDLSYHAIARALDMAVDGDAIRAALVEPEGKWKGCADKTRQIWWHGRIALIVNPEQKRVITVTWNTHGKMSRDEDDERFWRDVENNA